MASSSTERKARQILTWLGAAEQHLATRVTRLLKGTDLPFAQFVILDHLASLPGETWTVSRLASLLDTGQPGMSKIMGRLAAKGLVAVEADPADRRVKRHTLTTAGRAAHGDASRRLAPQTGELFTGWQEEHVDALHALLYRLKTSLRSPPPA